MDLPIPNIALPASLERLRALFATRSGQQDVIAAQQAALNAFLAAGLPTSRDEPWKYTSLRRFESRTLSLPEPVSPAMITT